MALSGQITVTTAGTAVKGTDTGGKYVAVKALSGNTGLVYVGNVSDDVTSANGFELSAGDGFVTYANLNEYYFDAATNGDKLCWLVIQG